MSNPSKYLGRERAYLEAVLNSESWSGTSGSWNQILEKSFARRFGARYAVAMNSGTATLHAALEAVGVGPGDEVISPALTVIMDTTATIHANAIPVYADIDPLTFNIDPQDVARKITAKTKAIIAVPIYGLPVDMDPLLALADKHGLAIIEDNAQCFLSTYKGRMTGTLGEMASYSFENTKHLSCGEGGILITNSEELAENARKMGGHGYKNLRAEEGRVRLNQETFQNPDYKRHDVLGWNYRMPEFNAAISLAQLERIDELVELRQKSAALFLDVMAESDVLTPQLVPDDYVHSYYTLGVIYNGQELCGLSWQDFWRKYVGAGGDGFYAAWSVPYLEPMVAQRSFVSRCPWVYESVSYEPGLCPVAESVQPKLMQFKTNYRNLSLAEEKAMILRNVLQELG